MAPTGEVVQQGPDAPHLDRTLVAQGALDRTARAAAFRARWGTQHVRWDERNGTPRSLLGSALPASSAPLLVADVARLGGVDPRTLVLLRVSEQGDRATHVYGQQHRGAPIDGGGVVVHARHGRISLLVASLHLPKISSDPRAGEVLLADHAADPLSYRWVRRQEHATGVRFVDRSDRVVHAWTSIYPLDLEVEERTVGDPLLTVPAREVTVRDPDAEELTDDLGLHALGSEVEVRMEGPNLLLRETDTVIGGVVVSDGLLVWDVDLVPAATTVQHHFHVAWDWLADRRPNHVWLDNQVQATVLVDGTCNAYYTNGTINFYGAEEGRCEDFGRVADVVYHELGHGFHHYVIEAGTFAGDVSEGSADYVSATILDDPVLAPESLGPGTYIREIETDRTYPDDATGGSHNDGLIWASFLWNLRAQWSETYGFEDGVRRTDELFLETLSYGPTLTDLTEAVIAADDDDADLRNGTPHACELVDLLNHHGLGPGSLGLLLHEHEPLEGQGSFVDGYTVDFTLEQVTAECGALDPDSVEVLYGVDLPVVDGVPFDPAVLVPLTATGSGESFSAVIPRQLPGARVSYAMRWTSLDGQTTVTTHDDRRDGLHDFFVGDREALWCADFEHGWDGVTTENRVYGERPAEDWVDEWERGAPAGQDWNPTGAWAGTSVIGTSLGGDGLYTANNGQMAETTDVRLSGANPRMALLTARRWLTVEDARYDEASVWADHDDGRELLWTNPATSSGTRHVIDVDWTQFDVDVRSLLALGHDVRFAFTLATDGGLEYGGWALDELCLVTLADEDGHYRVRDLDASDDQDAVTLHWTQPMMDPLSATVLVRKRDGFPADAGDGLIVDIDLAPVPGGARSVVDTEVQPGEVFHYAVFAAAVDQDYLVDVIEGDNADRGGVSDPELVDTGATGPVDSADSADSAEPESVSEDDDRSGPPPGVTPVEARDCGCAAAPSRAHGWWLLATLVAWRRRR